MIIDSLENSEIYSSINKHFEIAFKYLRDTDFSNISEGRYETDDNKVYALIQEYKSKPKDEGYWEAHRRFIDIHYIADGEEYFGYANINDQKIISYIDEKDRCLTKGEGSFINLKKGYFTICYPEDAHMTGITITKPNLVKKVIIKVEII